MSILLVYESVWEVVCFWQFVRCFGKTGFYWLILHGLKIAGEKSQFGGIFRMT